MNERGEALPTHIKIDVAFVSYLDLLNGGPVLDRKRGGHSTGFAEVHPGWFEADRTEGDRTGR